MTRTGKTNEPGAEGDGADFERPTRPLSPDLQAHIGVRLKAYYDSVLSEPIPDRFAELLNRLDAAETGAGASKSSSGGSAAGAEARETKAVSPDPDGGADIGPDQDHAP